MKNGFSDFMHLPVYLLLAVIALLNMLWIKPLFKSIQFIAVLPSDLFSFTVCISGIIAVFAEFYIIVGLIFVAKFFYYSFWKNPN